VISEIQIIDYELWIVESRACSGALNKLKSPMESWPWSGICNCSCRAKLCKNAKITLCSYEKAK